MKYNNKSKNNNNNNNTSIFNNNNNNNNLFKKENILLVIKFLHMNIIIKILNFMEKMLRVIFSKIIRRILIKIMIL